MFEEENFLDDKITACNRIGNLYNQLRRQEKAGEYYKLSGDMKFEKKRSLKRSAVEKLERKNVKRRKLD